MPLRLGEQSGRLRQPLCQVAVVSGDPLELSTEAKQVWVRGRRVQLENRQSVLRAKYRRLPR